MSEHYNPPAAKQILHTLKGKSLEQTQVLVENSLRIIQDWIARASFTATLPPGKHAHTHLGGSDNLVSDADPSAVSFGAAASPGDPHAGVSAAGHVHPLDADLEALQDLTGISFEDINGQSLAGIHDPVATRLVSEILLELMALLEEGT